MLASLSKPVLLRENADPVLDSWSDQVFLIDESMSKSQKVECNKLLENLVNLSNSAIEHYDVFIKLSDSTDLVTIDNARISCLKSVQAIDETVINIEYILEKLDGFPEHTEYVQQRQKYLNKIKILLDQFEKVYDETMDIISR